MFDDRVLSGMRPTGALHLGHYHGVLKNWIKLQHEHQCLFFVADWHALTTGYQDSLEIERLTLAAQALGIAKRCLQVMIGYANERKSFGRPIREHGQIQRYIAETFAEYRAARSFVYDTARRISLGDAGQRVDADATKLFAAQMSKRAADSAIQVLGGNGYMGEYVVERLWRDAKLLEIGGGTLEAHHKNLTKDLSRDPSLVL